MKQAKRFPFLTIQRQRLQLWVENHSTAVDLPSEKECRRWIWQAMKNEYRQARITVLFCDTEEALEYNAQYRNKNYATNILSFALNEGEDFTLWQPDSENTLEGDLIICPQVVEKEAKEQGKTITEHYAHLLVHGTLHLMGYDHLEESEAQVMESLEIKLMNQLGYDNPYFVKEV